MVYNFGTRVFSLEMSAINILSLQCSGFYYTTTEAYYAPTIPTLGLTVNNTVKNGERERERESEEEKTKAHFLPQLFLNITT